MNIAQKQGSGIKIRAGSQMKLAADEVARRWNGASSRAMADLAALRAGATLAASEQQQLFRSLWPVARF
jgi:hypothetical protein